SGSQGARLTLEVVNITSTTLFEVLQQQWRGNLNIDLTLNQQESKVWIQTLLDVSYSGLAVAPWSAKYRDPNTLLDPFFQGSIQSGTGWSDRNYDAILAKANSTLDPAIRMKKLADCEGYLLKAMPQIPISFSTYRYLRKPYVRGLESNALNEHHFKYAWIDTNWKPGGEPKDASRK